MRDGLKIEHDAMARRACVFNFLPLFTPRCSLAGCEQGQKVKSALADSAIFATRAKRAVNPCLNNNELISISKQR
jgi:hypothetical protein